MPFDSYLNMEPQQREIQTFATPSGRAFVLKTYLTAREVRDIKNVPLRHLKVGMSEVEAPGGQLKQKPSVQGYDAEGAANDDEDVLITAALVSYDGSSEDMLARLLDGKDEDFQAVLIEAQKLTQNPTLTK